MFHVEHSRGIETMDKIIKTFKAEVKSVDLDKKRAVVVVSTDKTDRDGDVIVPESMKKRIKSYKDHPILLSSHNYYDLMKQIGMCHGVKINDKSVECDFEWFVGKGNPEADWGWFLAQKGIAAFSIGFQGWAFDWIEEKDKESGNKRITGRKFTEIELLEVSQVLVPSNSGALQNSLSDPRVPVEAKEMAEMVLKGAKDGTINFSEFTCKDKNSNENEVKDYESRLCEMETVMDGLKETVSKMSQRITTLESINDGLTVEPALPEKRHYTVDLFGADGKDHTQTPESEAKVSGEIDAIKQAFQS